MKDEFTLNSTHRECDRCQVWENPNCRICAHNEGLIEFLKEQIEEAAKQAYAAGRTDERTQHIDWDQRCWGMNMEEW